MKYSDVREQLRRRISAMNAGDMLPSEGDLCTEYKVSRITVRRAIEDLASEGLVRKEQGRGTFVSVPMVAQKYSERFGDSILGFYTEMSQRGHHVGTRVIRHDVIVPPQDVVRRLNLDPKESVVELVRVRSVDGHVNHIVHTFVPVSRFPETVTTDFSDGSLYEFLRSRYGAELTSAHLTIGVSAANPEEAQLLGVPEGAALLQIASDVRDPGGTPIIHGFSRLRADSSGLEVDVLSTVHPAASSERSANEPMQSTKEPATEPSNQRQKTDGVQGRSRE